MPTNSSLLTRSVMAALIAALVAATGARGQDPDEVRIGLTYQPGYVPALAVAPVKAAPGLEQVAREAEEILRRDLDYSDRFEMIETPEGLGSNGPVNYALWSQLEAVWLVTADVSGSPSAPILRVGLHDVVYETLKDVRAFSLPALDAAGHRMAVHGASDAVVEWATDGESGMAATRIAFRRRMEDGTSQLFIIDSDGENQRRLSSDRGIVSTPALSPDGSRIAYGWQDMAAGNTAVYELDLSTGRKRTVSADPGLNYTPAYTPDGSLAFGKSVDPIRTEIFETGRGQLTTTRNGVALNPTFSPDGRRMAFEASPLGTQQIYVQPRTGGSPRLISIYVRGERTSAAEPDWSPRGDRIAYAAWSGGVFQIFSVNPDGTDRRVLTSRGNNEQPSWAPDGRHLVFHSTQRTGHGLWILDTVSGRARILVSGHVDETPDWSGSLEPQR